MYLPVFFPERWKGTNIFFSQVSVLACRPQLYMSWRLKVPNLSPHAFTFRNWMDRGKKKDMTSDGRQVRQEQDMQVIINVHVQSSSVTFKMSGRREADLFFLSVIHFLLFWSQSPCSYITQLYYHSVANPV